MFKRVISVCLAVMLAVGMVAFMATPAQAAYENTHVNTGNQRQDIIAVAVTQLGYGETNGGYTKYGEFHGNSYADWCGYFVSWCARQANVPTSVLPKQGFAAASSWGLTTFTVEEYETVKAGIIDGSIAVSNSTEALPTVSENTTVNEIA